MASKLHSWVGNASIRTLIAWGAALRLILLVYSLFHDRFFRVKYTDIDYGIIVDGAGEILRGGSPFDRTTYRYTPLLAVLVLPSTIMAYSFGKVLFSLCDLGAAAYAYQIIRTYASDSSAKWVVMLFILFNPVVLNVSTRGNSDMLITFMSMAVLAKFAQRQYSTAALLLGFAVHFKIYPVIYALPLVLGVWENHANATSWLQRLRRVTPIVMACGLYFLVGFGVPTFLCYLWYGERYLDEAFLYHIRREDHRHNFSPYWLLMYLNMGRRALGTGTEYAPGLFAFLPQAVVLLYVSWRLRRNIAHACCVETVLFVAFNKVCTVQYFVWFLPFLAFVFCDTSGGIGEVSADPPQGGRKSTKSAGPSLLATVCVILLWSSTIPLWVAVAYPLEFLGENHFGQLWLVSCVFFVATVGLASWLGRACIRSQKQFEGAHMNTRKAA